MLTIRQYLRTLDKQTLYKLFEISDITEDEYWLLRYAFIEKRMRENICMKLNISSTKYANMLNIALIKIEYKIKELDKLHNFS